MTMLPNPMFERAAALLAVATAAFGLGLILIRRVRKILTGDRAGVDLVPIPAEGLPVHAFNAVIQQLKQQKHQLESQQLSERRKAKASDSLSSAVLSEISSGVLFLNGAGLVRQANSAARTLLGFSSPVGMQVSDLFRDATVRLPNEGSSAKISIGPALGAALSGKSTVRGLLCDYITPNREPRVLEVTASPVIAADASLMGATLILNDKTELARERDGRQAEREASAEKALKVRSSLANITGYADQLAHNRDTELAHRLANNIAGETAELDRAIGDLLEASKGAASGS